MPKHNRRIVFLTYLNRSGSTFLAGKIAEVDNAFVSLEARIPDNILYGQCVLRNASDIDGVLSRLYADEKFSSWGVDREELSKAIEVRLAEKHYTDFSALLNAIFDVVAPNDAVCVYKSGSYYKHMPELLRVFPESVFVFVVRDPRAVYRSQKSSVASNGKRVMASNPFRVGSEFSQAAKALATDIGKNAIVVRYEDMMNNEEYVQDCLRRITAFASIVTSDGSAADYSQRIPDAQQHLHTLVGKAADTSRIEAWKNELSSTEVAIIEREARAAMEFFGYSRTGVSPQGFGYVRRAFWFVRHKLGSLLRGKGVSM